MLKDFSKALSSHSNSREDEAPPQVGYFKLFCDRSFYAYTSKAAVGFVLLDQSGKLTDGLGRNFLPLQRWWSKQLQLKKRIVCYLFGVFQVRILSVKVLILVISSNLEPPWESLVFCHQHLVVVYP